MARIFGDARAVEKTRLRKGESHISLQLRDFTEKTNLKTRLPSNAKSLMFTDYNADEALR